MALAPSNISCRQSSLSKRPSLPAHSSRGRGAHCSPSPACGQDPSVAAVGVGADLDLAIPRRRFSRRGAFDRDSCRSSGRRVTSAGRLSGTVLKLCPELNDSFWRRRRSDGTAWLGRSPFLFGGRSAVLCWSFIIQITFLSAVGCGSPHLYLAAAVVVRPASLQPSTTLHGGEERFPSAFLATKTRRKLSNNDVPRGSLEVREEAQSGTDFLGDNTPSSASVAAPAAINGTPSEVTTSVSASSANRVRENDIVSLLAGGRSDALLVATAAPASSQTSAPSQLQGSGSFVAAGASTPQSAPLEGAAAVLSPVAIPSRASFVAAASPGITTSSNSAAGATAGTPAFVADGARGGVGSAGGAAVLLPGSGPAPAAANDISSVSSPVFEAAASTGGGDSFRQGPVRERIVRPYSSGPTARAMSFAASSGIPLCHECNSFSDSSSPGGGCSRVCLHGEKTPNFLMPIRAVRTIDTHPQEVVQLLEANHHAHLNLNKNFYVLRGKGPFGSLGNSVDSLPRKEDATAAARLGLHFPELPHISFAQLRATEHTAATTTAAAVMHAGAATASGANSGTGGDEEELEKEVPVAEHLQLTLAEASVPIMQMKDSQYVGLLGIGTPLQYVEPVFDTGSTNLWVVGSDCKDDTCEKVTRFDPKASSTYRPSNPPVNLDITFGTGRINGCTAVDNFSIGPFLVKDQTFGLVQKESGHNMHGNIFKAINFEGIVGLAFPEMSSTGAVPLYDHLIQDGKLKANEFAFYMAKGFPVSGLFFGGVDPRFFEPPIHMFPVSKEHYWETALDAIYIGDEKFCCDEPSFVILDSGTSFNTLPGRDMRRLMEKIPARECDLDDPEFTNTYKPITYVIGGVRFPLKPEEYLVRNDKNECKPAFMQIEVPAEYGPAYILGSVSFMRHYYTVYRRSDGIRPSLVGIARAVHNEENKSYLANVLKDFPGVRELSKKGVLSLDKSLDFFSDKEL